MRKILRHYNGGLNKPLYQRIFEVYQNKGYIPNINEEDSIPYLFRKPDELLLKFDWTETRIPSLIYNLAFDNNETIKVPIFDLYTGEFLDESVDLDQNIFNVPLRRDLVKRAFEYYDKYDKVFLKDALDLSTKAGSNKKPHPQKGTGRARQGHRRAPGRYGGVKAHGRRAKMFRIDLPQKIRLQAKLAEGRIRITNNEEIDDPYTRDVAPIMDLFNIGTIVNVIVGDEPCENFMIGQRNIKNLRVFKAKEVNLYNIIKAEKTIITLAGLESLNKKIMEKTIAQNCPKNFDLMQLDYFREIKEEEKAKENVYDPSRPLKLRIPLLQQYLQEYEEQRKENSTEEN